MVQACVVKKESMVFSKGVSGCPTLVKPVLSTKVDCRKAFRLFLSGTAVPQCDKLAFSWLNKVFRSQHTFMSTGTCYAMLLYATIGFWTFISLSCFLSFFA